MLRRSFLAFLVCVFAPLAGWSQDPPLDPTGIRGRVLLVGSGPVPQGVIEGFWRSVSGAEPVLVVGGDRALFDAIDASAGDKKTRPQRLTLEDSAKITGGLKTARAVWFADMGAEKLTAADLARATRDLLGRDGVVVLSGKSLAAINGSAQLLPDCVVQDKALAGAIAVSVPAETALWIEGRRLSVLGKGFVTLRLAASKARPERTISLKAKTTEDLTGLRRAALERLHETKAKPEAPEVAKGTLIIIGGGGYPKGILERFVKLAGGPKASIVVLPTANDPLPKKEGIAEAFRKLGAKEVTVLDGRTRERVESEKSLAAFGRATGVWFGGGRQWRFVDAYAGSKAQPLMKETLARGGVIGGTSAGATIQGDYLCRGSPLENFSIAYEGYERGLGFLPGVAIDQHFTQRKRFADMTGLMKSRPEFLGIGIDETTAIVVQGHIAEVTGKGKVHFYDAGRKRKDGEADYEALGAGERYDLKLRRKGE
ncbi:MAG: cyanophycinase [Gemmataceae bacterium]